VSRPRIALAAAALCLYLFAAWRSAGAHQPDEYFQTVEFASEKLGRTPASLLPWEHGHRLRPYLQPAVYAATSRALAAAGVTAPAAALLAFRAGSALLNLAALLLLWTALARRVPDPRSRTWLLAACLFTFHLPYLSVRTSSEAVSGALLTAALAAWLLLEARPVRAGLAAGLLLGLAFDARYQLGLCIAGFGAWLLLVRRAYRPFAALAAGVAAAAALGLAVDRWGYGAWTLTPWNYLRANLIEGRAAHFGTAPFYQYVVDLGATWPPLPALAGAAVVIYWIRARRDPLTWTTAPLLVGHSLLAHKELRFLFPLAPLAAAMAALLFLDPALRSGWQARRGPRLRPIVAALALVNLAWLAASLARPVTQDLTVQAAVWTAAERAPGSRFVVIGPSAEPFWDFDSHLATPFLRPPRWAPEPLASWEDLEAKLGEAPGPVWAVSLLTNGPPPPLRERLRIRRVASAVPEWATPYVASDHIRARLRALWEIGGRP
jgi:phosphatidylinositol glycan class B